MNNHQTITPEDTFYYAKLSQLGIEEWLPIPGYEGSYEVSNLGRVKSLERTVICSNGMTKFVKERILSPSIAAHYYFHVELSLQSDRTSKQIHSLAASAFIGPLLEGMQVCHNNGISTDNRLDNLRYDTPKNNKADAVRHGTQRRGQDHHRSKLTDEEVKSIRRRYSDGESQTAIAKDLGISQPHISLICQNKTWQHI